MLIMKKILLLSLSLTAMATVVMADNTVQNVEQVTTAVTVGDNEDYHITSSTPFTATGSINMNSTSHGVLILDALKPTQALGQLGYVTVDGEPAQNGKNCDVRIYNRGALIFPYTSTTFTSPLTTYTGSNFDGDSCKNYNLQSSGGFMQTLSTSQLNNNIRSFRLKRGYMVTFAIGVAGWGYSRVFVAADNDLEVKLPSILAGRISSYRIFKWNYTSKVGLANNTDVNVNHALNTTSCYSFGTGGDTGLDIECVPHHIYEDWPNAAACGSVNYTTSSPNMKTNNEPRNTADDHPQTLDQILDNWQSLMRTGQRLCTPSSWDGSWSFNQQFLDSIDARGWRCDILDVHAYWAEGNFYSLAGLYNSGHRPIWISEWCWGASWNSNGAFASGVTNQDVANALGRICNNLNNWNYVERYFYWNSERSPSHVYENGALTTAGNVYANLNSGLGFREDLVYVPTTPGIKRITSLQTDGSLNVRTSTIKLRWTDTNCDLLDSLVLERSTDGGNYVPLYTAKPQDISSANPSTAYTYTDTLASAGTYNYRVHIYPYNGSQNENIIYSNTAQLIINGAQGDSIFQYGTVVTGSSDETYNYFATTFAEDPAIVFGGVSYSNTKIAPVERVSSIVSVRQVPTLFRSIVQPWTVAGTSGVTDTEWDGSNTDYTSYIIARTGTGHIGDLQYEAGEVKDGYVYSGDTVSYTFTEPFAAAPIVMATTTGRLTYPLQARVFDVTPTGFKIKMQRQNSLSSSVRASAHVMFVAIEKGATYDSKGKYIIVGDTALTFQSSTRKTLEYGDTLDSPMVLIQPQTANRADAFVVRTKTRSPGDSETWFRLQMDPTADNATITKNYPVDERFGYIVIGSNPRNPIVTGIETVTTAPTSGPDAIYTLSGTRVNGSLDTLPAGIYIVRHGGVSKKVLIK